MVSGSTDIKNVANVHKCIQISIARVLNKHFKYYILILFLLKDKYYKKWANGVVIMLNFVGISLFNVYIKVQLSSIRRSIIHYSSINIELQNDEVVVSSACLFLLATSCRTKVGDHKERTKASGRKQKSCCYCMKEIFSIEL